MNKDKTILIVDDEAELRQMVQGIFARAGYGQVLTAGTGAEALALCRQAMPDLVILDVMLPDIDGFAVLRALRQDSRVPVLMLTARGEAEDKFAGFEAGADDYLAKPFLRGNCCSAPRPSCGAPARTPGAGCSWRRPAWIWAPPPPAGARTAIPSPPRNCCCSASCTRMPAASSPPGPCAKPCAGRYGRAMRAPWPPISATCGKRSSRTPSRPVSIVTVKGLGYRLDLPDPKGTAR